MELYDHTGNISLGIYLLCDGYANLKKIKKPNFKFLLFAVG